MGRACPARRARCSTSRRPQARPSPARTPSRASAARAAARTRRRSASSPGRLRTPAAGRGPLGGHARARWPPLAGCKPAPATRPAGVRLIHGPGRSRRAAGGGPASRASARREGWHIGRRGQLADVGGHGARVQPAQEGHCGARRMLPLQRSRGRGGDARDGFLGRQALRPPQQPSALPARVLGNGWVHLPAARRSAPLQVLRSRARDPARSGITPNRPRSGAPAGRRRHRRRMRHAHQVVHGLKPPTRACWRTSAGHCTSSVRGSGCAGACTAAVATMHAAITAPCRLAPAARHLPPRAQRLCLGGDAAAHAVMSHHLGMQRPRRLSHAAPTRAVLAYCVEGGSRARSWQHIHTTCTARRRAWPLLARQDCSARRRCRGQPRYCQVSSWSGPRSAAGCMVSMSGAC